MVENETSLWVGLPGLLFVTIFGTGLLALIEGKYVWAGVLSLIGLGGFAYVWQHVSGQKSLARSLALVGAILTTWIFLGYDIYVHRNVTAASSVNVSDYDLDQQWGTYHYTEVWNQSFKNLTVELDGISYRNCSFQNVTFHYRGKAPFSLEHCNFAGDLAIRSTNPPVKAALLLVAELQQVAGKTPKLDVEPFAPGER
jgi:hypothetical protein